MLLINNEVDLAKSFEKLKTMLKTAHDKIENSNHTSESYSYAYGLLSGSIKGHIVQCTDTDTKELQDYVDGKEADPNDLTNVNI